MFRQLAHALLFALVAAPVAAQSVQGTVVTPVTREVRRSAHVALLDDSLRVVRETDTDSTLGAFYLDAPRAGRYSIVVYDRLGNPYASAPFQLDSGAFIERELALPTLPPTLDSLPVVLHLEPRRRERPNRGIRFPESEKVAGRTGQVRVAFIVDADGLIVPKSYYVIEATNMAFARTVAALDETVRFAPATEDGRPPRVLTQLTLGFNLVGAPPERGDLIISALGNTR